MPLSKDLLRRLEKEAKRQGTDRVKIINEILKDVLKLPLWMVKSALATALLGYSTRSLEKPPAADERVTSAKIHRHAPPVLRHAS